MDNHNSEVLPSGAIIIDNKNGWFFLTMEGNGVPLNKQDIARLYGIAFPIVRLSEKCSNIENEVDSANKGG